METRTLYIQDTFRSLTFSLSLLVSYYMFDLSLVVYHTSYNVLTISSTNVQESTREIAIKFYRAK